jgi:hypothetical protein
VNAPVQADTLVVEGWVPPYVLDSAVVEIRSGAYRHIFVTGMEADPRNSSDVFGAVDHLVSMKVSPGTIQVANAPLARWNRTSRMARAVADRIRAMDYRPNGVNVITLGPHGRQSRLALRRALGPDIPVGVITVPKDDYDPSFWWASAVGVRKTTKDFAGWLRELIFGLRSQ